MTKEEVQAWVREATAEAVADALKAANIVDGPTHLRHHQFIEDFCSTYGQVKKAGITAVVTLVVTGLLALLVLGFSHWSGKGS